MWQSILRNWVWGTVTSAAKNAATGSASVSSSNKPCDVGIVFALPQESGCFVDLLKGATTTRGHGFVARDGLLGDKRVVVMDSGAGREAAARATDALIVAHHPKLVISAGFAGGLSPGIEKGHIILADSVQSESGERLSVDLKLKNSSQKAVHVGAMVTVNRIVTSAAAKRKLGEQTKTIAVDMESLAVAEVCRKFATPFLAVRIISDGVSDELPRDIGRLIAKPSRVRQVGFALGTMLRRPSVAKDLMKLKQEALVHSDRLAKFLASMIGQLP